MAIEFLLHLQIEIVHVSNWLNTNYLAKLLTVRKKFAEKETYIVNAPLGTAKIIIFMAAIFY